MERICLLGCFDKLSHSRQRCIPIIISAKVKIVFIIFRIWLIDNLSLICILPVCNTIYIQLIKSSILKESILNPCHFYLVLPSCPQTSTISKIQMHSFCILRSLLLPSRSISSIITGISLFISEQNYITTSCMISINTYSAQHLTPYIIELPVCSTQISDCYQ